MSFALLHQNQILRAQKELEDIIKVSQTKSYVDWHFDIQNDIAVEIERWLCERYNAVKHHWGYRVYLEDPPEHILHAIITMPTLERMTIKPRGLWDKETNDAMADYSWIVLASITLTVLYFWS